MPRQQALHSLIPGRSIWTPMGDLARHLTTGNQLVFQGFTSDEKEQTYKFLADTQSCLFIIPTSTRLLRLEETPCDEQARHTITSFKESMEVERKRNPTLRVLGPAGCIKIPRSSLFSPGPTLCLHEWMTERITTLTIRGQPLVDLMKHLYFARGVSPLYIVGGAIRSWALGEETNDIDLVSVLPYNVLESELRKFFQGRNVSLEGSIHVSGKRKAHGMIKIDALPGTLERSSVCFLNFSQDGRNEMDALDIGPFKTAFLQPGKGVVKIRNGGEDDWFLKDRKVIEYEWEGERVKIKDTSKIQSGDGLPKYFFGKSFVLDSLTRDLTINSLYYDPFLRCVIDPWKGFDDLVQPRMCHVPSLNPCDPNSDLDNGISFEKTDYHLTIY